MNPVRLWEMMSTGSPSLIDHAINIALKHLDDEKPRSRHSSPYAIPVITHGLRTPMSSSNRSLWLRQAYRP